MCSGGECRPSPADHKWRPIILILNLPERSSTGIYNMHRAFNTEHTSSGHGTILANNLRHNLPARGQGTLKCNFDHFLTWHAGGMKSLEVEGNTVADCLSNLADQLPVLEDLVFDNERKLSRYVSLLLNGKNDYPDLLGEKVKNGDVLNIFYTVPS
jgi:hypothetical protein